MLKYLFFFLFSLFGIAQVSATSPVLCTLEYAPVCGEKPVQCITTPCDPIRQTYGNICEANAAGATDIMSGECGSTGVVTPTPIGGQTDSHGCLSGAGYSWDASMQACIRSWEYQPLVSWAHDKKLTQYAGLSDFHYGNILTRQEAATLATRAAEYLYGREVAMCKVVYRDSDLFDTTLTPGISRACAMGIMNGNDGYFAPLRGLTRGEALAVLVRAKDGQKLDETLTPWYQSYMDRAFELGLVFANPKGFDEPITRGEFVEWIKTLAESTTANDENLLGEWKLKSYRLDDMIFAGSGVTLSFTSDRYSAKICNTINASYTTKSGKISTGPAMSTKMACADSHITIIESAWNLDGATYAISSTRGDPRTWLTIRMEK